MLLLLFIKFLIAKRLSFILHLFSIPTRDLTPTGKISFLMIFVTSISICKWHKCNILYSFDTSNGIKVKESGVQKKYREDSSDEEVGTVSRGSYSFTLPDCTIMTVNWVADENGFQPKITYSSTPTAIIPQEPTDEEATTTIIPFWIRSSIYSIYFSIQKEKKWFSL